MRIWIALACVAAAAVAGCAHTPRGRIEEQASGGNKICAGKVCYKVGALPDGWRLVHQEGAAVGFFSEAVGGVIEANATCRDDADAAPLKALTRQLLIGYTERAIEKQEVVPLDAREALRTRVNAKLDGVPMTLELYVMKRDGCIFDLSYAAPPDKFGRGSAAFTEFVDGFGDARSPGAAQASRGGR